MEAVHVAVPAGDLLAAPGIEGVVHEAGPLQEAVVVVLDVESAEPDGQQARPRAGRCAGREERSAACTMLANRASAWSPPSWMVAR